MAMCGRTMSKSFLKPRLGFYGNLHMLNEIAPVFVRAAFNTALLFQLFKITLGGAPVFDPQKSSLIQ